MHDDVRPQRERLLQVGRREGVVHDQDGPALVGDARQRRDVEHRDPLDIITDLEALEAEITTGLAELKDLLS